jgi:Tol biopolymer transport system component
MTLSPGTRLGPYQVTAQIGAGGMGEVYRATDTTLARSVAIKVLPESVALDAERLARFEREAKTLASLNHPNIAQVYGFEKVDASTGSGQSGFRALVMELVEGPTLADRIAAGPIPIDEALPIARQIAEALEAAHDHGIIHRDLKPANVKVRADGTVKVLDFGLAKALDTVAAVAGVSLSPTITSPAMTHAGVILGTAAYMSPEQARGRPTDRRADIWAFGCVLFEMLAGRRPFPEEETVSDTIAGVLKAEPSWDALSDAPPYVRALVERCLRKDVRRRLSHIAEARIAIDEGGTTAVQRPEAATTRGRFLWPAVAAAAALIAAALGARLMFAPVTEKAAIRFDIVAPPNALPMANALGRPIDVGEPISPDGGTLAFFATFEGQPYIWIRRLDSPTPHVLEPTRNADRPAWSPDGQSLAFMADKQLKRVAIAGGPATILIPMTRARDISWGTTNVILIGGENGKPLMRMPADGGEVTPATTLASGETSHDYPQFLPDGRHFVYMARRGPTAANWESYVGNLDSAERIALRGIHAAVRYSPSGHLLFAQDGALMAVAFDVDRLTLTGEPFLVVQAIETGPRPSFSVSNDGTLAYLTAQASPESQLAWFGRNGTQTAALGQPGRFEHVRLSRDGRTVVFERAQDLLAYDIERGATNKVVSVPGADFSPVFSPGGDVIAFGSSRDPATNAGAGNVSAGQLYTKTLGAGGDGEVLFKTTAGKTTTDWSRDGHYLAFTSGNDVWAMPMPPSSTAQPMQVTKTPFAESGGVFSPDGRWIAYQSNDSAASQDVYVQSFPDGKRKYPVSVGGGSTPRWSSDSPELFYVSPTGTLMSVSIARSGDGLVIGKPIGLFESRAFRRDPDYEVAGKDRFLLKVPLGEEDEGSVAVIAHWTATLKQTR